MELFERFLDVIDSLEKEQVDYILIGGFSVVLYGMPRMTRDMDIFVNPEKDNIKRLVRGLYAVFKDESLNQITLEELKEYSVIRFGTSEEFSSIF